MPSATPTHVPLALYIHIPWCVRKCPYCDFNSHEGLTAGAEDAYTSALLDDLDHDLEHLGQPGSLVSVFFGGGTPSLFGARSIDRILQGIADRLPLGDATEITLEANPGTFEQQKFSAFRSAGINRLSIGIQSFNDASLQHIGRIHDGAEARAAFETARRAGFDNINLDLMFALPGQAVDTAVEDIRTACALQPEHLSHYQLTIEPNTWFHTHRPVLPAPDDAWRMQEETAGMLAGHGYEQYEVSAFARDGRRSRHNLNYWEFGDYLGIGAGAHGKITGPGSGAVTRRWKHRQPAAYLRAGESEGYVSGEESITGDTLVFEFLMNALRLKHGVDARLFEQRTALPRERLEQVCSRTDPELLQLDDERICTTDRGFLYLNSVLEQLLD